MEENLKIINEIVDSETVPESISIEKAINACYELTCFTAFALNCISYKIGKEN